MLAVADGIWGPIRCRGYQLLPLFKHLLTSSADLWVLPVAAFLSIFILKRLAGQQALYIFAPLLIHGRVYLLLRGHAQSLRHGIICLPVLPTVSACLLPSLLYPI